MLLLSSHDIANLIQNVNQYILVKTSTCSIDSCNNDSYFLCFALEFNTANEAYYRV